MARKLRDDEIVHPVLSQSYWVHYDADGNEHTFRREPNRRECPTLLVDVIDDLEITRTRNRFADGDWVRVRPRAGGWKLHDDSPRDHTVWSRPAP